MWNTQRREVGSTLYADRRSPVRPDPHYGSPPAEVKHPDETLFEDDICSGGERPRPFDSRALFARALEAGTCFSAEEVFSAGGRYANCLRLRAGYPWDARIEPGLETLGRMARAALARNG